MNRSGLALALLAGLCVAAPAAATVMEGPGTTQVPEPGDFALFAGGVIGLAIGRKFSKTRHKGE